MASTYLSRTPASNGNKKTFTLSCWVKRSALSAEQRILMGYAGGGPQEWLPQFSSANIIKMSGDTGSGYNFDLDTVAVFRDVSAWYHIVISVDTTQATAANRIILYVNGVQQTLTGSYPSQNFDFVYINSSGSTLLIGGRVSPPGLYFDGLMASTYFIDGQALTASSFGETDATTGIWKPKDYSGTYGTNGYFLKFANSASLGTDSSGNGNNFTVNGTPTQTLDTPSNVFATGNILEKEPPAYSNGNLTHGNGAVWRNAPSTLAVSSGKWYAEFKIGGVNSIVGIASTTDMANNTILLMGQTANSIGYDSSGTRGINNSFVAYGSSFTTNDIISIAMDLNNNALYFAKNGTWQNSGVPTSGASKTGAINIATSDFYVLGMAQNDNTSNSNYGNGIFGTTAISSPYSDGAGLGKFQYQPPAGYYALCTKNINVYG
jgi:hypothetical protein